MISPSSPFLSPKEVGEYGVHRIKFLAFDAVSKLWRRREAEGLLQKDLASRIGRDPGWVSKKLRGPGNWTLRTLGEFVEALQGELDITIHAIEDPISPAPNYHAYAEYDELAKPTPVDVKWLDSAGEPKTPLKLNFAPTNPGSSNNAKIVGRANA